MQAPWRLIEDAIGWRRFPQEGEAMKLLKLGLPLVLAAGALAATTIASAKPTAPTAAAAASAINCKSTMKFGMVTPLTGGAGFLGQEQLSWAKYAVKTLPQTLGLKVTLVPFDTPVEQGPAPAQAAAQKFVADPNVVGIIGPSTSGAVAASSKT